MASRALGPLTALALLVVLAMAGCSAPAPTHATATLSPLPTPDNRAPADRVAPDVPAQDPAYRNATHGPLPWRNECIRQWSSGAYELSEPPVVSGKPCLFLPTAAGTMYWTLVDTNVTTGSRGSAPYTKAAALPRSDLFFDWVYVMPGTHDLYFQANGSRAQRVAQDLPIVWLDTVRDEALSAVRVGDTVHVAVHDRGAAGAGFQGSALVHAWFAVDAKGNAGPATVEAFRGGGWFDVPVLRGDENAAVAYAPFDPAYGTATLYVTGPTGAFRSLVVPGSLLDVAVVDHHAYGCVGTAAGLVLMDLDLSPESSGLPSYSPIVGSTQGVVLFFCQVTADKDGPLVVTQVPPLVGADGGRPASPFNAQLTVYARRGMAWIPTTIPTNDARGEDDATVAGGAAFFRTTNGNGTSSSAPREGSPLFSPGNDSAQPWHHIRGGFEGTAWFLPDPNHPGRLLTLADSEANPPFSAFGSGARTSWVVVDRDAASLRSTSPS